MDSPRLLTNSNRSDRLLKVKLSILERTLKVRGVECLIIKNTNEVRRKVYGFNNIDLDGDRSDESKYSSVRLVLNLNALEHVGDKSSATQTVYHVKDFAEEGDVVLYRSRRYEYAFKVVKKMTYGELDLLYEYELNHFRTIKIGDKGVPKVLYESREIDDLFKDNSPEEVPESIESSDWRNRIKDLDIY